MHPHIPDSNDLSWAGLGMAWHGTEGFGKARQGMDACRIDAEGDNWINEQMYDVTDQIDLKAWEKTEKEAQAATGPGGQC